MAWMRWQRLTWRCLASCCFAWCKQQRYVHFPNICRHFYPRLFLRLQPACWARGVPPPPAAAAPTRSTQLAAPPSC